MDACHGLAISILTAGAFLAPPTAAEERSWGYRGEEGKSAPADWPGDCQSGERQSPIDIVPDGSVADPVAEITFDYRTADSTLLDNGHAIQVVGLAGKVTVGGDDDEYHLAEFHFHTPSEHTVRNLGTAAEVHFVHEGEGGALVVLGALIDTADSLHAANPGLSNYLSQLCPGLLPAETGPLSPAGILPDRGYYQYSGSLTTPGCEEIVTWFVAKEPLYLSACTLDALRAAYPDNARPVQSLKGRQVRSRER